MALLQTSFEVGPSGTAIPITGANGGDAFTSTGADGTGTTFTSDSSVSAAVASGTYAAKITQPATAAAVWRGWTLSPASSAVAVRMYVYLTAYPTASLDVAALWQGGAVRARLRITTNGSLQHALANGGVFSGTSGQIIPLNTLTRIEAVWNVTAGTFASDIYNGHSTTPVTGAALGMAGMAYGVTTIDEVRLGMPQAVVPNYTMRTDAWGVQDSTTRIGPTATATPASVVGVTAQASSLALAGNPVTPPTFLANPERGFFYYTETHAPGAAATAYTALSQSDLTTQRAAGRTLVFRYVVLDQFLGTDTIPQSFLDALAADFTATRNAGMKMVLRFTYSNSGTMTPPYNADPPRARVVSHIQQLAPTINAAADVVDSLHAGFIGMWGEWYYTDNFGDLGTVTTAQWADRKAVVDALLTNLDARIFVLIRYVGAMRRLIDADPTNTAYATRLSHHNDAFLADTNDWGTYDTFSVGYTPAQNRAWLASRNQAGRYPTGGESANYNPPRSDYATAKAELAEYRWSTLNPNYHPDVLASWGQAGRDDIAARLGYRHTITASTATVNGGNVDLSLSVRNDGFAASYRNRPVLVDFINGATVVTRTLSTDFRQWVPGANTITGSVAAPPTAGTYSVHLRIVDASPSLQANPLYSVRMDGVAYDTATGRNALGQSVTTTVPDAEAVTLGTPAAATASAPVGLASAGTLIGGTPASASSVAPVGSPRGGATTPGTSASATSVAPAGATSASARILGTSATATGSAPAGSLVLPATVTGTSATATSLAPAGAASGGRSVVGVTATATGSAPAGTLASGAAVGGTPATATGSAPVGSPTGRVLLSGVTPTATGTAPAGVTAVPTTVVGATPTATCSAPAGAMRYAKAETATNTFDAATGLTLTTGASVTGGELVLTPTSAYPRATLPNRWDILGSHFGGRLTQRAVGSVGNTTLLRVAVDATNSIELSVSQTGGVGASLKVNNVLDSKTPGLLANATHYRIKVAADRTITWQAMVKGVWFTIRTGVTAPAGWDLTQVQLVVMAGLTDPATNTQPAKWTSVGVYNDVAPDLSNTSVRFGVATGSAPPTAAEMATTQTAVGRQPSIELWYRSWINELDPVKLEEVRQRGHVSMLTWEAWDWTFNASYNLTTITNGTFDSYITRQAGILRDWGYEIWLRPLHEMNHTAYPWCVTVNGNTPAQFNPAWKHIVDLFRAAGATNVKFVWSPNQINGVTPLAQVYPGDDYVDLIALDAYNFGDTAWTWPANVFDGSFAEIRAITAKPLYIGETASSPIGGSKPQWISEFFDWLRVTPDIRGFNWFDVNKEKDWRVTSSTDPASVSAFSAGLATIVEPSLDTVTLAVTAKGTAAASAGALSTGARIVGVTATTSASAPAGVAGAGAMATVSGATATATAAASPGASALGVRLLGPAATATAAAPVGAVTAGGAAAVIGATAAASSFCTAGSPSARVTISGASPSGSCLAAAGQVRAGVVITAVPARASALAAAAEVSAAAALVGVAARVTCTAAAGVVITRTNVTLPPLTGPVSAAFKFDGIGTASFARDGVVAAAFSNGVGVGYFAQ